MKNRSHRWGINRPRSGHGHKHNIYKLCLSMIMVICIKQYLKNIQSSVLEKLMKS